ncbi:3-oxoacyl-[acyl-carrier-protein] reductase FabG [Saezia sanguinis]|uniref:3-oxoacyl-[acyl-carrier-protein] reductase FabG n=1 Tax=Saezia sanguinis TaxID=1965230 RepID=A0A433SB12_9BURK|nr:SDR family oxidoreductase [Saezia sanguinis]RUS65834.1 3-oxoacyl-[acyl-carrier-protein] reductase FabG [Saezia sanguinis]
MSAVSNTQTWFITGAGGGFGLELTRQLLALGKQVAATTRASFDALNALQAQYPRQLWVSKLDVTELDSIAPVIKAAHEHFGSIDVLVSNAGYVLLGALEELEPEQIHRQLQTNLYGPIFLIRAMLPYMRQQKHGRIIQLSSEAGQITFPALSLYHASKWGIEGFCESVAREVAAFDIHITIVQPGRASTDIDEHAQTSVGQLPAYQQSTVGLYRKLLTMGRFPSIGDPVKIATRIIEAAQAPQPPLRLALGEDAYKNISRALQERLQQLEAQKDVACSTSRTDGIDQRPPQTTPRPSICQTHKKSG